MVLDGPGWFWMVLVSSSVIPPVGGCHAGLRRDIPVAAGLRDHVRGTESGTTMGSRPPIKGCGWADRP